MTLEVLIEVSLQSPRSLFYQVQIFMLMPFPFRKSEDFLSRARSKRIIDRGCLNYVACFDSRLENSSNKPPTSSAYTDEQELYKRSYLGVLEAKEIDCFYSRALRYCMQHSLLVSFFVFVAKDVYWPFDLNNPVDSLKGGDPAAPSGTATLLRLHPSHRHSH